MKKFIYYPSLSSGNSRSWLRSNYHLPNGTPTRFWSDEYKAIMPEYYHPYFLLSAGHCLNDPNLRTDMGLEKALVIGDSGGYQIATGAIKFDVTQRKKIFDWLEANSDVALNLDIPPRLQYAGHFNESLAISLDNFKFFQENQSGKTNFLNVLQGNNENEYKTWFNAVSGYEFNGWAIGGAAGRYYSMMYALAVLLENKVFEKKENKFLHILGLSSLSDFIILAFMQKQFNLKFDNRVQLSTDSSTPNRATVFGTYYYGINWNKLNVVGIPFTKADVPLFNLKAGLPCSIKCKSCEGITFESIATMKTPETYAVMTAHNMNIFINAINAINTFTDLHDNLLLEIIRQDLFNFQKSIKEMFNSNEPMKVYEKYKPLYMKLSSGDNTVAEKEQIAEFFDFVPVVEDKKKIKKEAKIKAEAQEKLDMNSIVGIDNSFFIE